jgi:pyruvate/2-oxoglutarate dehydrogenase complex dihydrolipoamide dehydrogenase (E3) component
VYGSSRPTPGSRPSGIAPRCRCSPNPASLLKLLVNAETREIEGVHIFGTAATELLHIGQTVMAAGLTLDYLVEAVFNYPTFADAYKVATLDAMNKLNDLAVAA